MTTYYMDYVNGNDSNSGVSWALAKKTVDGYTAAILNPGDVIRVAKSSDPTSLGQNATWNNVSKTVTLTTAVTATIDNCESGWTAGSNVTLTYDNTVFKQGGYSLKLVTNGSVTGAQKLAYKTLGSTDFSSYKQISFWFNNAATTTDGLLQVILCSDTTGDTPVDTFNIPGNALATSHWLPLVIDKGSALGAAIQSIAIYCTGSYASKTNYFDNFIACKDSTSADSLNLTSLIAKDISVSKGTSVTSPGTAANDATVGTLDWTDINNIKADDANNASANVPMGGGITHYAKATNFGFTFDSTANIKILGIKVEVKKSAANPSVIQDYAVKIVKADGSIGTTDKKDAGYWPTSEAYTTYGGATELWGETWTATDISDADFGVVIAATNTDGSNDQLAYINHVRITVYYKSLSEGWYPIQSIDGTTVLIDNSTATLGNAGKGYYGTTESSLTYKRETIKTTIADGGSTYTFTFKDSGTLGNLIQWEGGYNTSTSLQDGETFFDGQASSCVGLYATSLSYNSVNYLSVVRYLTGYSYYNCIGWNYSNLSALACDTGFTINSGTGYIISGFFNCNNNTAGGIYFQGTGVTCTISALLMLNNNVGSTYAGFYSSGTTTATFTNIIHANNGAYGITLGSGGAFSNSTFSGSGIYVNYCTSVGFYFIGGVGTTINSNIYSSYSGTAVYLYGCSGTIFNGTVTGVGNGHGLYYYQPNRSIFNGDISLTSNTTDGIYITNGYESIFNGNVTLSGGTYGVYNAGVSHNIKFNKTLTISGTSSVGFQASENNYSSDIFVKNLVISSPGNYGIGNRFGRNLTVSSGSCSGATSAAIYSNYGVAYLSNFAVTGTTFATLMSQYTEAAVYMSNCDVAPYVNKIFMYGGLIQSDSGTRHTASGIAWKLSPTSTDRDVYYPVRLSLAKIAVNANATVTVTGWFRRDNLTITGTLLCEGYQVAGVNSDVSSSLSGPINTWEQLTISFLPTAQGVVEICALAYGGSTYNVWVDDLNVSQ